MTRFSRWAVSVLALFTLMFFILFLNRVPLGYSLLKMGASFYAVRDGVALDIGAVSGNFFSEMTVENLAVKPAEGQPQRYDITARSIQCRYDLWTLRDGLDSFIRGLACSVEEPVVRYDSGGGGPSGQTSEKQPQFVVPAELPRLEVRNGSATLSDKGWVFEIEGVNAALRSEEKAPELRLDVRKLRVSQEEKIRVDTGFSAKLRSAGEKVIIDSLDLGKQEIMASGWVDLGRSAQGVTGFNAEIVFAQSRLTVKGSTENEFLKMQVTSESFDLAELQKRLGGNGWDVSGKLRGEAELAYNFQSPGDLAGSFSLAGEAGRRNGVAIDTVAVSGTVDAQSILISAAGIETSSNRVTLRDVSIPVSQGSTATALSILAETRGAFVAASTDVEELLKIFGLGDDVAPTALKSYAFSGRGKLADGVFFLDEARAADATTKNRVLLSNVSVPVSLVSEGRMLAIAGGSRAEFDAELNDVGAVLKLFKLEGEPFSQEYIPDALSFRGKLAHGALMLDHAEIVAADSRLTVEEGELVFPVTAESFGAAPLSLRATLDIPNLIELGKRFELPVKGGASADLEIKGSVKAPRGIIRLTGENLEFKEMVLGSIALQGEVVLLQEKPGSVQSAQFNISELKQVNNSGTLALLSPITGAWQPEGFSLQGVLQADRRGEISIDITRSQGGNLSAAISTRTIDSEGWLANFIDKRAFFHGVELEALFTGPILRPQIQLAGTVESIGTAGVPFPLTGKFRLQYSPAGIEISEFTWQSHDRNQMVLTGHLPYDPLAENPYLEGEMSLQGHVDFPALEDISVYLEPLGIGRGSLALDLNLAGSWDKPVGKILLAAEGIQPPAALKSHSDSPMSLSCDITAQGDTIILKSATLESTDYTARATGSWQDGVSFRELLQKHPAELKGVVEADAVVKLKDLNFLRKQLPWLRRLEGDLEGEIHVAGPVTGPAIKGSFSLEDGEASHVFNFPMLSAINLQGDFDEHSITIKNMQAELGGSPVNLGGRISREKEIVTVSLHGDGKNVLLFRNNDMGMRGDVELDLSGPLESLLAKGKVGLTSGYYKRNIDFLGRIGSSSTPVSEGGGFLFSFTDPPLKNAVFDIQITTIEPFRIRNNLIRGTLRPELTLKGTGELPYLVGTIYIDPSRILLPSGRLQIQSGLVRFLEGEPDRPQLDIIAQSKLMGYDINVVTRGSLDDPVITLSSSPALPNDDLLLLLLTGQPPQQNLAVGSADRGTRNVMVYLGRDFLNKWLVDENGTGDESILDRFELDFGRDVTKSGEQTVNSTFRLSKQTAGSGDMYYLAGEKDKYDAYNYGLKMVFRFE